MKLNVLMLMLFCPLLVFAFEKSSQEKLIDFERPGLIDQTGDLSNEFINEQNWKIKAFTERTGILLRVIYTTTKDVTESTGTLLRGIDDTSHAILWVFMKDDGIYYAIGENLFDVYDSKACTMIKVQTEKQIRKGKNEKALVDCIDKTISYGEKSALGRFFYEYGGAIIVIGILTLGSFLGIFIRKRKATLVKK